jgi:hypothetical protein
MRIQVTPKKAARAEQSADRAQRKRRAELRELKQAVKQGALTAQQEKRLLLLLINELLGDDS